MRHVRRIIAEICAYTLVTFILTLQTHPHRHPFRPLRPSALPPPHITYQVVELGFSPENGFDVQAATALALPSAPGRIYTSA
jgi:hypothetical protein